MDMESVETPMSPEEELRWRQNEAHGELLAQRLSRLVERGYRPVFMGETEMFDLVHPNPKATPVQLWPDGQVVDRFPTRVRDGERTIIHPEDEPLFASFLAAVPKPTLKERFMSATVGDVLVTALAWVILLSFMGLCSLVVNAIWHALAGR